MSTQSPVSRLAPRQYSAPRQAPDAARRAPWQGPAPAALRHHGRARAGRSARPLLPQGRHRRAPARRHAVVRAHAGPDRHQPRQPRDLASAPAAVRSRLRRHHRRQQLLHPRPQRQGRDRGDAGGAPLRLGRHLASTTRPRACGCSTPSRRASRASDETGRGHAPAAKRLTGARDLFRRHLVPARLPRHRPALHPAVDVARLRLHALEARLLAAASWRRKSTSAAWPSAAATARSTGRSGSGTRRSTRRRHPLRAGLHGCRRAARRRRRLPCRL